MSWPELSQELAELAARHETVTYSALAARLGLDGPRRIARLTAALEALMEEDAAQGAPLRAALVLGRAAGGLPARGFFDKARALGVFDGQDPERFHAEQIAMLFDGAMRD